MPDRVVQLLTACKGPDRRVLCASADEAVTSIDAATGHAEPFELNTEFLHLEGLTHPGWA